MPLASFLDCYSAEIAPLEPVGVAPAGGGGVGGAGGAPLEHLITCVPGVKVAVCRSGVKKVQWAENKTPAALGKYVRPGSRGVRRTRQARVTWGALYTSGLAHTARVSTLV